MQATNEKRNEALNVKLISAVAALEHYNIPGRVASLAHLSLQWIQSILIEESVKIMFQIFFIIMIIIIMQGLIHAVSPQL
jgi:hypothetical protein